MFGRVEWTLILDKLDVVYEKESKVILRFLSSAAGWMVLPSAQMEKIGKRRNWGTIRF